MCWHALSMQNGRLCIVVVSDVDETVKSWSGRWERAKSHHRWKTALPASPCAAHPRHDGRIALCTRRDRTDAAVQSSIVAKDSAAGDVENAARAPSPHRSHW